MTNVQTITEARDDTSNDKLSIAERCSLENRANDHDDTAEHDGLSPAQLVAEPEVGQCAHEAADFLGASD